MKSMLKSDFYTEVKINGYEVFTAEQIKNYTQEAHDDIQKSVTGDKSKAWAEVATEVRSFTPVQLTDDDTLQKSIVFYREAQVIWDKAEGDDISKARSGVYANTIENRKLGRVGHKYGSKKAEEPKGASNKSKVVEHKETGEVESKLDKLIGNFENAITSYKGEKGKIHNSEAYKRAYGEIQDFMDEHKVEYETFQRIVNNHLWVDLVYGEFVKDAEDFDSDEDYQIGDTINLQTPGMTKTHDTFIIRGIEKDGSVKLEITGDAPDETMGKIVTFDKDTFNNSTKFKIELTD